jgi:hypothetical protein
LIGDLLLIGRVTRTNRNGVSGWRSKNLRDGGTI